jgi:hypothetical protein
MKRFIVRYRVRPEVAAENERLVRDVFRELEERKPEGFRYATFKLEDGVSFMHVVSIEEGEDPLRDVAAFRAFVGGVKERCVEGPVTTRVEVVGEYRSFGG